jgi:hypothetical protein
MTHPEDHTLEISLEGLATFAGTGRRPLLDPRLVAQARCSVQSCP